MEHPLKSISIAALISISILAAVRVIPAQIHSLNNSDWLLLLLGALAISVYLLSNTYLMSQQIAANQERK